MDSAFHLLKNWDMQVTQKFSHTVFGDFKKNNYDEILSTDNDL